MSAIDRFRETKDRLDKVSPSFCMAKWQQVTMHLHNGTNHSCHHPRVHYVPIEELNESVDALHNSLYKKEQRKKMLAGERPAECQYCWNVEDNPVDGQYSDRVTKSSPSSWNRASDMDSISTMTGDEDVYPTYLEVSFSNRCNLKCSYCSPIYSSSWQDELERHSNYDTISQFNNLEHIPNPSYKKNEYNPHLEAFKVWWESAKDHVRVLRITGGEPLLEKTTFEILEDFASRESFTDVQLAINSNLMVSPPIIARATNLLASISSKVNQVNVFTSCEAAGSAADYIRTGLEYDTWLSNLDNMMAALPNVKFTIMTTVNNLSITTMDKFLSDILQLKLKHINSFRKVPISLSFNMLRHPFHQRLDILPKEYHNSLDSSLKFMEDNQEGRNGNNYYEGFFDYEIHAFKRLITFMTSKHNEVNIFNARKDFYSFFTEFDKRRGTSFQTTFPEMVPFMELCKREVDSAIEVKQL